MTEIIEIANKVIDAYCADMKVDRQMLAKKKGVKLAKVDDKGKNLSFIRQSLGYFLYKRLPIKTLELGKLIGYSDHSTVSLYSRIVESHIEIQDPYFMPYYNRLVDLASPIVEPVNFERITTYFYCSVDKKVRKIRSVRNFSV